MGKWKMVRLGDVANINMGQSPSSETYNNVGVGLPFFQGKTDFGLMYPTIRMYCSDPKKTANNKDILISVRAPVGSVNIATQTCCIGRGLAAISEIEKVSYYRYLFYYLKYKESDIADMGVGSTFKAISRKDLDIVQIPLPPLEVQKKIADVLDKASELINLRKAQLNKLDLLVKSQFIEMFGDPVTDSKKWGVKPLRDSLNGIRYGTSTPPSFSKTGFAFICATNIKQGRVIDSDMKFISEDDGRKIEKCRLNGGELIIVRSGVNTGDTCVVPMKFAGHYAGYDIIVETNANKLNAVFLNELINTSYKEVVVKPLTARSAQPHLNAEQVKSLPLIQVPLDQQNRFANFVQQADKSTFALQQSLEKLELNNKSIMQKCFRGIWFE